LRGGKCGVIAGYAAVNAANQRTLFLSANRNAVAHRSLGLADRREAYPRYTDGAPPAVEPLGIHQAASRRDRNDAADGASYDSAGSRQTSLRDETTA
jgi:hypothetical protein